MTNPTSGSDAADANGWFPQVFASEGANFDIILKTSGGSTLASYLSVAAIGAQSGSLSRDFTNSRFAASGTSGIVSLEAGDPTGDNVGGKMRVGGWAGTQADDIELDGVLVNVTGRCKERSKKIPGTVYTEGTASGVSAIDITLPNDPTGVVKWVIEFATLTPSVDADISLRLSLDNGATYKSGATDYGYDLLTSAAGTVASTFKDSGTGLVSSVPLLIAAKGAVPIKFLTIATTQNVIEARAGCLNSTNHNAQFMCFGGYAAGGNATNIRIIPSTGTISGVYRVIPQRGLGET